MDNEVLANSRNPKGLTVLTAACLFGAVVLVSLISAFGVNQNVDSVTLPVAGRTLNGFTAIVLTCIALIVPLTANLYTPKLVTVYVRHPLIVTMLSGLMFSHIICLVLNFLPTRSALNHVLVDLLALIYLLVVMCALPFLFGLSRFLRPSYFMPMLTRRGIHNLQALGRGRSAA
ncbi:MAG TPA: hypothetical protein VN436_12060, partial [Holophaga sp.]|nr:hypothetical protein [Holophaga sp.]